VKLKNLKLKTVSEKERILNNYRWSSFPGVLDTEKRSKYLQVVSYMMNINVMSLTALGKGLGGISGSGVGYVHSRFREKINNDKALQKKFSDATKALSILETPVAYR
jgi:hypothetical protein